MIPCQCTYNYRVKTTALSKNSPILLSLNEQRCLKPCYSNSDSELPMHPPLSYLMLPLCVPASILSIKLTSEWVSDGVANGLTSDPYSFITAPV